MKIEFTARRATVDPKAKAIAEKKLAKLARVLPPDAQAHIVLRAEKKGIAAEVTVVSRQRTWTATELGAEQEVAVRAALDRIEGQAKKAKAKVHEDKKHTPGSVRSPQTWSEPSPEPVPSAQGPRRERVPARSMFEEDALTVFSASKQEVLIYRDLSDDSFRVLYRRRDGRLRLLVPG